MLCWLGLNNRLITESLLNDPDQPDGQINLTASAFNRLGQYTSSHGGRAYTATQNSPFSS